MMRPEEQIDVLVDVAVEEGVAIGAPWHVILFNDEIHAFDEVVLQVMKATGCTMRKAAEVTLEAHQSGQAGVHSGDIGDCVKVQAVLSEIALQTELRG